MFTSKELYLYSASVRRKFLEKLETLPWEAVTKNREASYLSMKDIMLHMVDNEDQIVSGWIRGVEYKREREWTAYENIAMIKAYLDQVEARTKAYLNSADDDELQRRVTLRFRSGPVEMAVEECLLQSFTEQLFHLGELIALMWQDNVEPPSMQWFRNNPRAPAAPA